MDPKVKILLLEDNELDADLLERSLTHSDMKFVLKRVETKAEFLKAIKEFNPHIILSDYNLPSWDGISALEACQKLTTTPFIIVSGFIGEEKAVNCMKTGAFDYVPKDHLIRLPAVIQKALEKTKTHKMVQELKGTLQESYQELEFSYQKLKEIDELKSDFVSIVSHELRTPICIIKGAMQNIQGGLAKPEEKEHVHDMIIRATDRLTNLIEEHLDLTRIEHQKMQYHIEPIGLDEVVQRIIETFEKNATDKEISLENNINQGFFVLADMICIERIFNNLVGNSLKCTPPKGKITLSAMTSGEFINISVSDTGCGIAKEDLPELFQKYRKVKLTNRKGGIGLGLAICKLLAKAQGGDIWVNSEVNQGAIFTFCLPLAQAKKKAA